MNLVIDFLLGLLTSDTAKAALATAIACTLGTWYVTSTHYEKAIAKAEAERAQTIARTFAERERDRVEAEERLAAAINERDDALSRLDRERSDSDALVARLRQQLRSRPVSRTAADSCQPASAALARCERLLSESVELLDEGRNLLKRNGIVHDALTDAVKARR